MGSSPRWQALALALLVASPCPAGSLGGEAGATIIDGEPFWTIRFQPSLVVGKLSVALDMELLFRGEGVREEEWGSSRRWVRLIRAVGYGHASDPLVIRLSGLDALTLGHGFLVRRYTNWYDYDYRRLGAQLSLSTSCGGAVVFSSTVDRWEIVGGRAWTEPFRSLHRGLRPLRIGATWVSDRDPDGRKSTADAVTLMGVDVEYPLIRRSSARLFPFADVATIHHHGSGLALGLGADVARLWGVSGIELRAQWCALGAGFLPEYVDAFYGVDRYDPRTGAGKEATLLDQPASRGWGWRVAGTVQERLLLDAGFSHPVGPRGGGGLHLEIRPHPLGERWELAFRLDEAGLRTLRDVTRAERVLGEVHLGYRFSPLARVYLKGLRTFRRDEGRYRAAGVFVPRVGASVML